MVDSDWHNHSRHSPCGAPDATLAGIARRQADAGGREWGVTDHLHCRLNIPALEASRREFDALRPVPGAHFGVEVSCLRQWDLRQNDAKGDEGRIYGVQVDGPEGPLTTFIPDDVRQRLKIEYVIGGAHWPLGAPLEREAMIRSYHRQNMFLAEHPRVDIVAHPWWWMGAWQNDDGSYTTLPWLDDFGVVPRSMHLEFAAATIQSGSAVEINATMLLSREYPASFRRQYREYLAMLKEAGVTFAIGSDSHDTHPPDRLGQIEDDIAALGLRQADLWRPGDGNSGPEQSPRERGRPLAK